MLRTLVPDPAELESKPCDICGAAPPAQPQYKVRDFVIVKCPHCGVLRVDPRLKNAVLRTYYDRHYWSSADSVERGYGDYFGDAANIKRTFRRRLRKITGWTRPPGRLLDVGCAGGFLLEEASAMGWDAWGVEWSEYARSHAAAAVQMKIMAGTLAEMNWKPGSVDVITFWDYLEHSPCPRQDCRLAADLLRPGGFLSIIIPDAGSWLARLMGARWEELKKPQEHLYFFTRRQLETMLTAFGLQPLYRGWAGKYASLDFALSRFQPGDGWLYLPARFARRLLRICGGLPWVLYVNPRDKLHLLCRKEPQ
ncbi:class I SAM-dependent methyltransferase [candidate division FCPU426 bacterium]|nr:class I SAM-dependent methyltransferase [candidate division FCPU426 bacterium]